jgi:ACDE family multidrug resistance protein
MCAAMYAGPGSVYLVQRRIALTVYRPAKPGVNSFAILASLEALARSLLISVYPVLMYRSLADAKIVSEVYLAIGVASLAFALLTPLIARHVARRWLYTIAMLGMMGGSLLGLFGGLAAIPFAVALNAVSLVTMAVCFNAYVLDYIERHSLGRNETARLLFSGAAWTIGPYLGVWLMDRYPAAPFIGSILAVVAMIAFFWWLRMGNGKVIQRARRPAVNPLTYLPRFFRQPLLVAGWTFAVIRSAGWAVYIIYVPIYAVESGLSSQLGGMALSISNAFLFLTPYMLKFLQATSVRIAIFTGFLGSGLLFVLATVLAGFPPAAIGAIIAGTMFLVSLDISGGLPFLMGVKPSERTEMAAVYSTFRDVSAVVSPAMARLVLVFSPVAGVFAACGLALLGCALAARTLHPRLGRKRLS